MVTLVGNGQNTIFWKDRWLNGGTIADMAPEVVVAVAPKVACSKTFAQCLPNRGWVSDIKPVLSISGIQQYLLWDLLENVLLTNEEDQHLWRHTSNGTFSSNSCYRAFFRGSITFEPWKRLWKSWAPQKCKFFLWLALRNKCWTADNLGKRGLPHPSSCPLCDQESETVQHILSSYVFAQQFWFHLFSSLGMGHLSPRADDDLFEAWF